MNKVILILVLLFVYAEIDAQMMMRRAGRKAPVSAEWTPASVDSLKVWCESRFYDYADGVSVANWRDTSGEANHWVLTKARWTANAFGSIGAYRMWQDSGSFGRQDSIVKYLRGSDIPFTVFMVVKVRNFDAYAGYSRRAYFCAYSASETPRMWLVNFANTAPQFETRRRDDASSEVDRVGNLAADTTALKSGAIVTYSFEGDSAKIYVGATVKISNALDVGAFTPTKFFINTRDDGGGTYTANFDYGAFLLYRRELTSEEQATIREYLATQYGL